MYCKYQKYDSSGLLQVQIANIIFPISTFIINVSSRIHFHISNWKCKIQKKQIINQKLCKKSEKCQWSFMKDENFYTESLVAVFNAH